jgi:hypothetical protein
MGIDSASLNTGLLVRENCVFRPPVASNTSKRLYDAVHKKLLLLERNLRNRIVGRHLNTQSKFIKAGIILLIM